ncbi:MAG: PDDEXK nuclease domain-containing protein [Mycobacteriaceae bacterium]
MRRYIVFELKVGRVEPEHLGQLNFYVNAVDDLLRRPEHGDGSTIGILPAADRDDVVVEYALRGYGTPLAVSTYTTHRALPEDLRPALPSPDELAAVIRGVQRHRTPDT